MISSGPGSGIAISDRHIATNYHVVDGAQSLIVTGINGNTNRNYEVEVVAADKFNDLAILHVNDNTFKGFPPFKYGFSMETKDIGTEVFVLGYPLITTMGEDIKLTNGIISAKTGFQGDVSLYQISAPIQPGNSSGPLFDDDGDLIGIVNAKHTGAENVGYAIKLLYLKNLIESADLRVPLASTNSIRSLSLKEKVKTISPVVVMIKANVSTGENRTKSAHMANGVYASPQQIAKAEELCRKAYEAAQKADYVVAYNYIKQCSELYPNNASMLLEGVIDIYAQKNDEAIVALEYCIKNNYNIEYAAEELGGLYEQKGEYEKAISYYTKCINSNGRNLKALFRRGFCKGQMNNREEVLKDYKQVIKFDGLVEDNYENRYYIATSYNNIAYGYMCLGFVDARVNDNIMKALEKLKLYSFMWDTNGEYAYRVGEYERCISSMNNAIAISKANKETDRANSYFTVDWRISSKVTYCMPI
jgi:tetratricopeptide (TPR) repeat protein